MKKFKISAVFLSLLMAGMVNNSYATTRNDGATIIADEHLKNQSNSFKDEYYTELTEIFMNDDLSEKEKKKWLNENYSGSSSQGGGEDKVWKTTSKKKIFGSAISIGNTKLLEKYKEEEKGEDGKVYGDFLDHISIGTGAKADGSISLGYMSNSTAWGSMAIGDFANSGSYSSIAMGLGAITHNFQNIALGSFASSGHGYNNVAIGHASKTKGNMNSIALGAESVSTNTDELSIGNEKLKRKIVNVAKGEISENSTDAINGSQLYSTNQKVEENKNNIDNLTNKVNQGFNVKTEDDKTKNHKLGDTVVIKGDGTHIQTKTNDSGEVIISLKDSLLQSFNAGLEKINNFEDKVEQIEINKNNIASQNNKIVVLEEKTEQNTTSINRQAEEIEDLKEKQQTNSSNISTNTNRINVLEEKVDKNKEDINMLINQQNQKVENKVQNIVQKQDQQSKRLANLENGFKNLDNKINHLDKKLSGGIASANAMAGLGQATLAGESAISVGLGTFQNKQAVAIGVSRISDNGKWLLKLSGSTSVNGGKPTFSSSASATNKF